METVMFTCIMSILIVIGVGFVIGEGMDMFVCPVRFLRRRSLFFLRSIPVLFSSSFFLVLTGSTPISLLISAVLLGILVTASNLKLRLLNEPLVFTDFSLLGAFVRHPRFYLQGIPVFLRVVALTGGAFLVYLLIRASSAAMLPRYAGLAGTVIFAILLWVLVTREGRINDEPPALWDDVHNHGLLPVLMSYAVRCRSLPALSPRLPLPRAQGAPDAVIIVQCESFADPAELNAVWNSLPALTRYQNEAIQWGKLLPSGLGAYTMRSEYGVLCGDDEECLSYRLFDPFLTADQSPSHALPHRLKQFYEKALFLHPYDIRFYGRDRMMPLWGFTDIVSRESFSDDDRVGPYVSDDAVADCLLKHLTENERSLAYCVTIENHGPWKKGRLGRVSGEEAWYEHVRHSDAMLDKLVTGIRESGRDVLLVFFGDHRPALKALPPIEGLERSTPYVMLRPNDPRGRDVSSEPVDVTPAELHRSILRHVSS